MQYTEVPEENRNYVKFYPWVGLFFLFQSVFFYLPRYAWTKMEGHKVQNFLEQLPECHSLDTAHPYLRRMLHTNKTYALYYLFCEVLNLCNVLFQMMLTDWLLGNTFSNLGWQLITLSEILPEKRTDSLSRVFPKVAACVFPIGGHYYGSKEFRYPICILPVNIFIEKAFIFQWLVLPYNFLHLFVSLLPTI